VLSDQRCGSQAAVEIAGAMVSQHECFIGKCSKSRMLTRCPPRGESSFRVHTSLATDNHVANSFAMTMQLAEGERTPLECIFIYRVDEAGLLPDAANQQ
jgi:hypothetical protein